MENFNPKNLRVVFAGCARDCEPFLQKTLENIKSYSSLFKESFQVIIENGSKDKTREILKKNQTEKDHYLFEDHLNNLPVRGLRLEKARNTFIEKIKSENIRKELAQQDRRVFREFAGSAGTALLTNPLNPLSAYKTAKSLANYRKNLKLRYGKKSSKMGRPVREIQAHEIRADGANFDRAIVRNKKIRKELNKIEINSISEILNKLILSKYYNLKSFANVLDNIDLDMNHAERWNEFIKTININLIGSIYLCRQIIPHFKKNKKGKIIQLSGGGAANPLPLINGYAVSKAAVVRFVENLSEEVKNYNIDVNAVAPGPLNTRMLDEVINAGPKKVGNDFFKKSILCRQFARITRISASTSFKVGTPVYLIYVS